MIVSEKIKCFFKGHNYDLSPYKVNYINQRDPGGHLRNIDLITLTLLRPLVNCKRCKRKVKYK